MLGFLFGEIRFKPTRSPETLVTPASPSLAMIRRLDATKSSPRGRRRIPAPGSGRVHRTTRPSTLSSIRRTIWAPVRRSSSQPALGTYANAALPRERQYTYSRSPPKEAVRTASSPLTWQTHVCSSAFFHRELIDLTVSAAGPRVPRVSRCVPPTVSPSARCPKLRRYASRPPLSPRTRPLGA